MPDPRAMRRSCFVVMYVTGVPKVVIAAIKTPYVNTLILALQETTANNSKGGYYGEQDNRRATDNIGKCA